MGATTGIEWTDRTWNPWVGCRKVSDGCRNCYMFREMTRFGRLPTVVQRSKPGTFQAPLAWAKKGPAMVFTCSWSDFFIEQADEWRAEAWEIIRQTPNLTYQILTKRLENVLERLPADWGHGWPNVWLGASVENQTTAKLRISQLMQIPARVRFLSVEPLIGFVDLIAATQAEDWAFDRVDAEWNDDIEPEELIEECEAECDWINYGDDLVVNPEYREYQRQRTRRAKTITFGTAINWVIAGGESGGAKARPCDPTWVCAIRDACQDANVAFFFKQWGEYQAIVTESELFGKIIQGFEFVGRKAAGRLLDGREWNEFPDVRIRIGRKGGTW